MFHLNSSMATTVIALAFIGILNPIAGASGNRPADFDKDGRDDLAVGVPSDVVSGRPGAGSIHLFNGDDDEGLELELSGLGTQDLSDVADVAETNDHFGEAMAWGDFDGDGYSDVAVGVPFEDVGTVADAGAVHVVYGGVESISLDGAQFFTQNSAGIADTAETGDRFGLALATGDFNNDGYDDLAIGVPYEDLAGTNDAGAVHVMYGSAIGLKTTGSQLWTQDLGAMLDQAEAGDRFGLSLVAGDFTGDGYDELAIGIPYEDLIGAANAGAVSLIKGTASKLTSSGNQFWTQNSPGVADTCEANDHFGLTLAAGDFNGDNADDLAIGVPDEDLGLSITNCGAVNVLYSSLGLLRSTNSQFWSQSSSSVPETAEDDDRFGFALAAGDTTNDGYDELLIGVPNESVGSVANAGAVHALRGSAARLTTAGTFLLTQNTAGITDLAETGDGFGQSLTLGDFDGDGFIDAAIGVPFENIGSISDAGAVNVIFGGGSGYTSSGNMFFHQNTPNVEGSCGAGDQFGGQRVHL